MKEMWTGIHHKNGDEIYEVRFKTNDFKSYKFVQNACREALDTNWTKDKPCQEDKVEDKTYHWIKIDDVIFDLKDNLIIEYTCSQCNREYLFKPDEMEFLNEEGLFTCKCGHEVKYEKI